MLYSLKFLARVVPTPLFLAIYVIMTTFPEKLTKCFRGADFYFLPSHFFMVVLELSNFGHEASGTWANCGNIHDAEREGEK